MRPFLLDTDIGTNVDDVLALLLVLGSPELDLVGVTTVSGRTGVRAAVARHVLGLAGRPRVPVVAGAGGSLAGVPARWAGYEDDLAPPSVARPAGGDATDWLRDVAVRHGGRLEIGAIGPLTNLARALRSDRSFAAGVRRVHLMGGGGTPRPDHNLAADPVAAAEVVAGLDVRLCGVDATGGTTLDGAGLRAVLGSAASAPQGRFVLDHAARQWADRGVTASVPHDPLALLAAVRPDLVETTVAPTGVDGEGRLTGEGPRRERVTAIRPEGVAEAFRRIAVGAALTA